MAFKEAGNKRENEGYLVLGGVGAKEVNNICMLETKTEK
jgi:hypothetical protein